jgi:hypothetical protein
MSDEMIPEQDSPAVVAVNAPSAEQRLARLEQQNDYLVQTVGVMARQVNWLGETVNNFQQMFQSMATSGMGASILKRVVGGGK